MRDRSDLEGAFALLERQADAYDDGHDADRHADRHPVGATAGTVHDLVPASRRRPGPRVQLAAALVAAAAVAALAVALARGGSGHRAAPAGPIDSGPTLPIRTLPFTVVPHSGYTLIGATTDGESVDVDLVNRSAHVQVGFNPADPQIHPTPGHQSVLVGGRRGYWVPGDGPALTAPADPSAPPSASSSAPAQKYADAVVWEYAPGAWALVTAQGMAHPLSQAALVQAAEALDVAHPAGVRIPFTVQRAPAGTILTRIFTTYHDVENEKPPFPLTAPQSSAEAQYVTTDGKRDVEIVVTTGDSVQPQGDSVQVGGRAAHYSKKDHTLFVDYGSGTVLSIIEQADGDSSYAGPSLDALRSVADTVHLVGHPDNQTYAEWPDARTLP